MKKIRNILKRAGCFTLAFVMSISILGITDTKEVYAASTPSIPTVSVTDGRNSSPVFYSPNTSSSTQDSYHFKWYIGDTSKTTANDSNYAILTKLDVCRSSCNWVCPNIVRVQYNGKTYALCVTEIGDGQNNVWGDHPNYGTILVNGDNGAYVTKINAHAFEGSRWNTLSIGGRVTEIGDYAFANGKHTQAWSLNTGSKTTKIGSYAFANNNFVDGVTIGSNVTSIGSYAFSEIQYKHATLSKKITIPSSVSYIGDYAFKDSITFYIDSSSASTGSYSAKAFYDCNYKTPGNVGGREVFGKPTLETYCTNSAKAYLGAYCDNEINHKIYFNEGKKIHVPAGSEFKFTINYELYSESVTCNTECTVSAIINNSNEGSRTITQKIKGVKRDKKHLFI